MKANLMFFYDCLTLLFESRGILHTRNHSMAFLFGVAFVYFIIQERCDSLMCSLFRLSQLMSQAMVLSRILPVSGLSFQVRYSSFSPITVHHHNLPIIYNDRAE